MDHQWRLFIDAHGKSGASNMAADQALLDEADRTGSSILRLYRWDPPCLSFGRNESATGHYDRVKIERLGIDVVRRPTGGNAVWHEHEVTYAVAAPIDTFGSLREAYCAIHEKIAAALRSLGADASLAPTPLPARPPTRAPACFESAAGGEILVNGRKLVGSAQVRKRRAFLQHGSILLGGSQEMIAAVSIQPSAFRRQTSDVSGATTLAAALGRAVAFEEVTEAVIRAWDEPLTSTALHRPPPPSTVDSAWTWRR